MIKIVMIIVFSSLLYSSDFKDIQILDHIESKSDMNKYMKSISKDLGVKCAHCHNMNNKAMNTPEKDIAREMMILTNKINEVLNDREQHSIPHENNVEVQRPQVSVTCWTCHKGSLNVETIRP